MSRLGTVFCSKALWGRMQPKPIVGPGSGRWPTRPCLGIILLEWQSNIAMPFGFLGSASGLTNRRQYWTTLREPVGHTSNATLSRLTILPQHLTPESAATSELLFSPLPTCPTLLSSVL